MTTRTPTPAENDVLPIERRSAERRASVAPVVGSIGGDAEFQEFMGEWSEQVCAENYTAARATYDRLTAYLDSRIQSAAPKAAPVEQEPEIDRENMRIGQEIQRAAGGLPDGWNIEVQIERGYGSVVLYDDNGNRHADYDAADSDGLSYAIGKAIDAAPTAQQNGGTA